MGSIDIIKLLLSTALRSSAAVINLGNIKKTLGMPGIEPGMPGSEAQKLPPSYAVPLQQEDRLI